MREHIAFKLAAIVLVVAIPLAVLLGVTYWQWYESRIALIQQQRLGYAQLAGTTFGLSVAEMLRIMHTAGVDFWTRRVPPSESTPELKRLARQYPVGYVLLADSKGKVLASSDPTLVGGDLHTHPAVTRAAEGKSGTGVEAAETESGGWVGFHVAVRIDAPGRPSVVMVALVDARRLHAEFPTTVKSGGISVIDPVGQVVFQNEDLGFSMRRDNWGRRYPFVRRAMAGHEANTTQFAFPQGGTRIGGFVPIRSLGPGWVAGSSVNARDAMQPVNRAVSIGVWIVALLLAAGLVTSLRMSEGITRSLRTLSRHAERIGNGQLGEPVVIDRRDEIGAVGASLERARVDLDAATAENLLLFERQVETSDLNDALNGIDSMLHSTFAFRVVVWRVLERSAAVLGCSEAGLDLRDRGRWFNAALWGESAASLEERGVRDYAHVPELEHAGADTIIIAKPGIDEVCRPWIGDGARSGTSIAVPLVAKHEVRGLIYFNRCDDSPFSDAQVEFVSKLARSLSLAYENARLYAETVDIAETLQTALLVMPDQVAGLEFAHKYSSATEAARVGGDFYDLFTLSDGRVGITIGDMSGHGIDAAVLTSLVKNSIRAHAIDGTVVPAQVMSSANEILYYNSSAEVFATVFFALLQPGNGRMTYCNAGHTTALRVGSRGKLHLLPGNSPFVGAIPGATFENTRTQLAQTDILLLYTDGITEARQGRDFFGESRVAELLTELAGGTPQQVVDALNDAVSEFAGGRLVDDMALLAVRRRPVAKS